MLEILTVFLFLLVAGGTAWAATRSAAWRARGVRRLAPAAVCEPAARRDFAGLWREWLGRLGSVLPASAASLPLLKRRLLRAGLRQPNAARFFLGIRLLTTVLFAAAAAFIAWQIEAESGNALMSVCSAAGLGYIVPMQLLLLRIGRRQHAISRGLPNALDLMVVCVESGLGIDQTMLQVAKELQSAYPEICGELTVMNLELRAGKRRAEALHNLADRTGVEELKKLVAVLVQTDRFGTSIAQCLRGHAEYMRTMARQRAEERASKLAVKLVFPIFFCVLPSLFVVTVGPVITRLVRDLFPMIENM
jgi:tight adherence protein C